ncbi:hypothetical protein RND81_13G111500 [Saponaria officinalis]|uniref:X8 domain-containing protein n=1 Tax=Saponaria officinalis TaxID=3572 RepID=A0AAW1GWI5_SAPOF
MKMCTIIIMQLLLPLLILAMVHHSSASFCVCKPGLQSAAYQKAIDYACGQGAECTPIRPNGQCYNPSNLQLHCSFAANSYFQKYASKGATCDFQGAAVLTNADPSGGGCSFSASSGTSGSTSTGTGTPVTTVPTTSPTTPTTTPVTPVSGGGIMPVTPVSGTGTGTGTPTSGTGTGMGTGTPTSGTGTGMGTGTPTSGTGTPTSGTGTGMGTGTNPTTTSPYSTTPNMGNPTSTGVLGGGIGLSPTGSMDDNHGSKLENICMSSILVAIMISGIMCM